MNEKLNYKLLLSAIMMLGFTSLVGQVVLIRELVIVFTGNELTLGLILGIWLLWTAAGSGWFGRFAASARRPIRMLLFCLISLAFTLPLSVALIRLSKTILPLATGEISSPIFIVMIPLVTLAPTCIFIGILYPLGCRLLSLHPSVTKEIPGRVFLWESIGSGIAGFIASIFFFRFLSNFNIITFLFCFNLGISFFIILSGRRGKILFLAIIAVIFVVIFVLISPAVDSYLQEKQWRNLNLVESATTIYGNIAVAKFGDSISFYENGMLMFTHPDLMSAEESVHYALLAHPSPAKVLLIGGSIPTSLEQILYHPDIERVDYVLLDPVILKLAKNHIPSLTDLMTDERIHINFADGRKFIERTSENYDAIIIDLPDPETTLINRFYTLEFFRAAQKRLKPTGILTFSISSSENVLSQTQRTVLNCLHHTLQQVFPHIVLIPGNSVQFIAGSSPHGIQSDPHVLVQRLKDRQLPTQYVREYFIPYRMSEDRMAYIANQIGTEQEPLLNRDFKPIGYFNSILLWLTYFNSDSEQFINQFNRIHPGYVIAILLAALLILTVILKNSCRMSRQKSLAIYLSIAITGFTAIAIEVQIILGFQAIYGYAYYQLALIMSGFMIGLTLGSWSALKMIRKAVANLKSFMLFQAALALYPLLTFIVLIWLKSTVHSQLFIQLIFLLLISGIGFIGGIQFPIANHLTHRESDKIERTGGSIYAMDLTGSLCGALITSAILVPLFGLGWTCLFFCGLNSIVVLMLYFLAK